MRHACVVCGASSIFLLPIMAHAASQLKKNRGEVDVNALEDEKEKRRKSRRAASREQKRKVTDEGWLAGWLAGWLGWWLHLLRSASITGA